MNEQWKSIPGYEGLYEVSNLGRVRSLAHRVPCAGGHRVAPGKTLNPFKIAGYPKVNLVKKNKSRGWSVHELVLISFVGPRPSGYYGCHENNIADDNRLENLRWDTPKANSADQIRHGTKRLGDNHHNAKLTSEAIQEIRTITKRGTGTMLAKKYGVSDATISLVRSRKVWA